MSEVRILIADDSLPECGVQRTPAITRLKFTAPISQTRN